MNYQSFSSFQYAPLSGEAEAIRLLRVPARKVNQGSDDYTLFQTSLQEASTFFALSYCWGYHVLNHKLRVNGQMMFITESLALALENLQDDNEEIVLWADAICINQNDPFEKTSQVKIMRHIYRRADRVIIWLGPSTPETPYTVREMRKLGDELINIGFWDLSSDEILHWEVNDDDMTQAARTKRKVLEMASKHLQQARQDEFPFWWILSDLGQRSWFHRIWCVQECTNAQVATFRCGHDEVDYVQFWAVALYIRIFSSWSHSDVNLDIEVFWKDNWLSNLLTKAIPTTTIGIRRKYLVSGGHDLRSLLERVIVKDANSARIDATDPRDRVYALVGIANDAAAREIVADYTLSCEQAYIMTARTMLKYGHDDILSLCRIRDSCQNLPSWVPDWSADLRKPWSTWHVNQRLFNASGLAADVFSIPLITNNDDRFDPHFKPTGTFVDTIKTVGHSFPLSLDDELNWTELGPYFDDIKSFLSQSSRYTPEQRAEAEWRIPIGDLDIAEATSQVTRTRPKSDMKLGYAVANAMATGNDALVEEKAKTHFLPFGRFRCQLGRMYDSRSFISESGYVGLCPLESQTGDTIAIFVGARVPYVIRQAGEPGTWTLVGEAHVYGIMDGEFMLDTPPLESIVLT
ncbi:heterokaryon incompatibility protein-domain-containing protein [Paraphoma chrysanthemicola]|uniref:Heterokaryon incompatibility protein-domain-containing protein n=1 Tax=Paraphoma chrysanthemicola TaxID=798071 RepID=A0A8K0QZA0_9PLEO|nr:heterokaryon incompatibility protein-domain-containing protein [Paraphoma chrysanthemicola]